MHTNIICLGSSWNYSCKQTANSAGDREPFPLCLICLAEDLLPLHLPAHRRAWGVAGHLRCLLLPWIWAQQLGWHQLLTIGGQPEHGPQYLWHKPACCSCHCCSWDTCTVFWVQIHIGSTLIIAGNKQAWAQLKSYSIALSVTLHRSCNSWCNKADGQNKFDLGQIEIRRKQKMWNFPTKAADSQLVLIPFTNNSARGSDLSGDIFPILPRSPCSYSLFLFQKMFPCWMLVKILSELAGHDFLLSARWWNKKRQAQRDFLLLWLIFTFLQLLILAASWCGRFSI